MQDKEILKQFNVQKFPSLMVMGGVTQVCGVLMSMYGGWATSGGG